MVVLDTGTTADLVCFDWLARQNRILERQGVPGVTTYPSKARSRFSGGRLVKVRHAVDIPAFLRKGAAEALGGQSVFSAVRRIYVDWGRRCP